MIINPGSTLDDIRQSIAGTWAVSTDKGWKVTELGKIKLYKKLCTEGTNALPDTFMSNRQDITGYLAFTKNNVTGGVITLQQQAITLSENSLVIIIAV